MRSLAHHLLIASPHLDDVRFADGLIYIAQHDSEGAFGMMINQSADISMSTIFADLYITKTSSFSDDGLHHVLHGGPVSPEIGFVLHTGQPSWHSSFAVADNVSITTSKDILVAIAHSDSPSHYHVCLGYAGWGANQLETEIEQGDWFVCPASHDLLFELPLENRFATAMKQQGIDSSRLDPQIGHA